MNQYNVTPGYIFPRDTDPNLYPKPHSQEVALVVSRRDIEAGDLEPLLRLLQTLTVSPDALKHWAGRLTIVIDGYNLDPRDVCEVPEIRQFFEALEARWPYLPFFLLRERADYLLYFSLAADGRRLSDKGNPIKTDLEETVTRFSNSQGVLKMMLRFMEEMTALLHQQGVNVDGQEFDAMNQTCRALQKLVETLQPLLRPI